MATKKIKLVHVFWVDSMALAGWRDLDTETIMNCESVGFLIHKDKDRIVLAKNRSYGDNAVEFGHHMHIPLCAVKKIKYLK